MKNRFITLLAAFAMAAFAQAANAGLINDTVHGVYLFPDAGTTYADLGAGVVDADGVNLNGMSSYFNLTVTDTQVIVDFNMTAQWASAAFNGFMLSDLTKAMPAVTMDAATNMGGFGAGNFYVSGNDLYVNWQGLNFDPTMHVVLNVGATDLPEPVSISLLGLGLLGLGASQRRRK